METNTTFGNWGESKAVQWLLAKGYEILHRNWRYRHYEIDIIARKNNRLHFIEVKTRRHGYGGYPEDNVTRKKFKFLQHAAHQYLQLNPNNPWIQYDVLAILLGPGDTIDYFLLEDVFL